jgi:hypothetical protein
VQFLQKKLCGPLAILANYDDREKSAYTSLYFTTVPTNGYKISCSDAQNVVTRFSVSLMLTSYNLNLFNILHHYCPSSKIVIRSSSSQLPHSIAMERCYLKANRK